MVIATCTEFVWHTVVDSYRQAATISVLPDNVLHEIFCFYKENDGRPYSVWKWHLLVHVRRRWRQVVFTSPLRLDLRIFCTSRTPVRKYLDILPALPIFIGGYYFDQQRGNRTPSEDNTVTALEHADRVCDVRLHVTEKISTAMQKPFPVLKSLHISSRNAPVLPTEFLGGSAPRLQSIDILCIPFPALPTLLLSTGKLTRLELRNIPRTGYISPAAMVVGLAAFPRLIEFTIDFRSATPHPDPIHPPPITRTILPAFAIFHFWGTSEYLEDLVARIDAPQLKDIFASFWNPLVDFRVVQLPMFIDRSAVPRLTQAYAEVLFHPYCVNLSANSHANFTYAPPGTLTYSPEVHCEGVDQQVSHMAQVLSHFSATLSNVAHLGLRYKTPKEGYQIKGIDNVEWLPLLRQFSTVQLLHVSKEIAGNVALALEGISGDAVAEALPSLDVIYLMGLPASSIKKFLAARQLSGRPVTVIDTDDEFRQRVKSHFGE